MMDGEGGRKKRSKVVACPKRVFWEQYFSKNRHKFKKLNDAYHEATAKWKQLSAEEQKPYRDEAKMRAKKKKNDIPLLDSYGRPVEAMAMERTSWEQLQKDKKQEALDMVKEALESGEFLSRDYVVGFVHIYCKEVGEESLSLHYPAEFGVAKFSLREGLHPRFAHSLIKPKELGELSSKALESKGTHLIDYIKDASWLSTDYVEMRTSIKGLLEVSLRNGVSRKTDPIFIPKDKYFAVLKSLEYIWNECTARDLPKLLYLEDLVFALRENVDTYNKDLGVEKAALLTPDSHVRKVLDCGVYDYNPTTACKFHEDVGDPSKCALGYARQRCYLIVRDVCPHIFPRLVAGKHTPPGTCQE